MLRRTSRRRPSSPQPVSLNLVWVLAAGGLSLAWAAGEASQHFLGSDGGGSTAGGLGLAPLTAPGASQNFLGSDGGGSTAGSGLQGAAEQLERDVARLEAQLEPSRQAEPGQKEAKAALMQLRPSMRRLIAETRRSAIQTSPNDAPYFPPTRNMWNSPSPTFPTATLPTSETAAFVPTNAVIGRTSKDVVRSPGRDKLQTAARQGYTSEVLKDATGVPIADAARLIFAGKISPDALDAEKLLQKNRKQKLDEWGESHREMSENTAELKKSSNLADESVKGASINAKLAHAALFHYKESLVEIKKALDPVLASADELTAQAMKDEMHLRKKMLDALVYHEPTPVDQD